MRRQTIQWLSLAVLVVALGSHISELLDHWDHTLQTGNDIESVLVVVALSAGVVLAIAGSVIAVANVQHARYVPSVLWASAAPFVLILGTHSPPPTPLRI
jgi:hypothetical protein